MKVMQETLFERIRNRMAPANAVKVIAQLEKAVGNKTIDFMVVKEASEMVERYALEARVARKAFRRWEAREAISEVLAPLKDQEGRLLLAQARQSASLYLDARRDYRDLVKLAMGAANAG